MLVNNTNIPLSLAVWLGNDDYDHSSDPKEISATTLLKPIRSLVLLMQNPEMDSDTDISSLIPSRIGTAIHNAIEAAWTNKEKYTKVLSDLGFPQRLVSKIIVNPKPDEVTEDVIPVYMELRGKREIEGWVVTGKFDFVAEGRVEDFKSTSVYSYITGRTSNAYVEQGSIYRWLHPDIITADTLAINYIFTDWSVAKTYSDPDYPKSRLETVTYPLMPLDQTEAFISNKLRSINSLLNAPQDMLPECTPEELWQKPTVYKYYKDPAKTTRSTKNFTTAAEAYARLAKDGNVGTVKEVIGDIIRCKYCDAVNVCEQAHKYIAEGTLKIS